jgi:DNA (cytosine-5)-methyltransferase 1
MLVLSLFPGIDLLGRGFEREDYCVVRGPDLLWGGDIRNFHPPGHKFDGIIGGSPCQDFSRARRAPATGYGLEMLEEFNRCVIEAGPSWFLLENVPCVPDVHVPGYVIQRFDLNANECGLHQNRLRHFQFGSRGGLVLVITHVGAMDSQPTCLATEGRKQYRRGWRDFCSLQGLHDFDLPGWSTSAKYAAVGNGVPIPMGQIIARAIREAITRTDVVPVCVCGCARAVHGKQVMATAACRKRMERRRKLL